MVGKKMSAKKTYSIKNAYFTTLYLIFGIIALCFFSGTKDSESIDLYIKKLQTLSEHKLKIEQIYLVRNFYLTNTNRHPNKSKRKHVRSTFNTKRQTLRDQWSLNYNQVWPQLIISRKGKVVNERFQAHHIVPINAGGVNLWWNLTPLSTASHSTLHNSIEEKACFSHNSFELYCYRFALRLKCLFLKFMKSNYSKRFSNFKWGNQKTPNLLKMASM